jgi:hypothetical protein
LSYSQFHITEPDTSLAFVGDENDDPDDIINSAKTKDLGFRIKQVAGGVG